MLVENGTNDGGSISIHDCDNDKLTSASEPLDASTADYEQLFHVIIDEMKNTK